MSRPILDKGETQPMSPEARERLAARATELEAEAAGLRALLGRTATFARRDMLRAIAARYFPGKCPTQQAEEIVAAFDRYIVTAWPRERTSDALPAHREGTLQGDIFQYLKANFRPLGARSIRGLLGKTDSYALPKPDARQESGGRE